MRVAGGAVAVGERVISQSRVRVRWGPPTLRAELSLRLPRARSRSAERCSGCVQVKAKHQSSSRGGKGSEAGPRTRMVIGLNSYSALSDCFKLWRR
eukprot:3601734-Rhodomonas_salina.1